ICMNTGEEGFKVYQRTPTKNMGDKEQRPPPSDEMSYLQELMLRNQRDMEQSFQRTMRASMIELIQAIQGAPELKKSLGDGSSSGNERTSINPPTRTFRAKFLQREEEEQVEVGQQIGDDEMDRFYVEYQALRPAIRQELSFLDFCTLKSRNGHKGGRRLHNDQPRKDIQQ
ncbi:hypothetical protein KI387_042049, partial [Taxus chinensis]